MRPKIAVMDMQDKNDATVLLRLPNDLKAMLLREAAVNGRRITAEINMRLKASLQATGIAPAGVPGVLPRVYAELPGKGPDRAEDEVPPGMTQSLATQRMQALPAPQALAASERQMLAVFRGMSPEKQLALLSLFK